MIAVLIIASCDSVKQAGGMPHTDASKCAHHLFELSLAALPQAPGGPIVQSLNIQNYFSLLTDLFLKTLCL